MIGPAVLVEQGLRHLYLPPLVRPPVGPTDAPTEELVLWAIRLYVYSSIAHTRTILAGLITLASIRNEPAAIILCRHNHEWAVHSCFMVENLGPKLQNADWKRAWDVLREFEAGNTWLKRHGPQYDEVADIPASTRVVKLVAAYEKYQERVYGQTSVQDDYGYLSEHSHANSACLLQYRTLDGYEVSFSEAGSIRSLPGLLHRATLDWLMLIYELLRLSKERFVLPTIVSLLEEVASTFHVTPDR